VPFAIGKDAGRKLVLAPVGTDSTPVRPRVDNAMVKALARAFRWRRLMETGRHGSIEELAAAEKINASYVSRILRLTLLAPDIVEAILDGRQPAEMTLAEFMKPFPPYWNKQRSPVPAPRAIDAGERRPQLRAASGLSTARSSSSHR
jgi:hypothetical protein